MPNSSKFNLLIAVVLLGAAPALAASTTRPASLEFDRDVATIFASRCFDCHNPTEKKGGLDLTQKSTTLAGGENGAVIVPGKPDESQLWQNVSTDEMPPKHPLPAAEKETLRRWIASGAAWGTDPIDPFRVTTANRAGRDWWSLQPVKRPVVPESGQSTWGRNAIDRFVLPKLQSAGLRPSPEADKRTLIRRLTFDLTGLPPTPEEVQAFLADSRPDAYERLVDRLLASPAYGVRFARLWLDLARFGESHGFERDRMRPNAWRYRDWVVDVLNSDLPYDQFARMQLAGDVIAPNTVDGIAATGFLVAAAYDDVGNAQQSAAMKAVVRQDELEDITGTVTQTFLGLTSNCARCHDHKFDPISQREYYQLAAALSGVTHGERDLPADAARASGTDARAAIDARIKQIDQELASIDEPVRRRLLAERGVQEMPPAPKPLASWRLEKGLEEDGGALNLKPSGKAISAQGGALRLEGNGYASTPPLTTDLTAKTLEAWVSLSDLKQRGGGLIGVQTLDGAVFDAIVFGEREPGRWLAGSDHFKRSQSFEGPEEKDAIEGRFIHIAITWAEDGTIAAYREGQPYGKPYKSKSGLATFEAGKAQVVLGLRHSPSDPNKLLRGLIRNARLYDRALSPLEVAASAGVVPGASEAEVITALSPADRERREQLVNEHKSLRRLQPRALATKAYACVPVATPAPTKLLLRGNPAKPGDVVPPSGIVALVGVSGEFGLKPDAPDAERRLKLADWITDARNPLFARVLVNRLWQAHFGAGIVDTPSDFGFNGGRPSHPELLDWLASEFAENRWSQKHIHRLIVTSAAYRQASTPRPEAMKLDASNRLLWRQAPRRLEAEALRDAMLLAAGELNPALGGPGFEDYYTFTHNTTFYEFRDYVGPTFNRRSLYRTWIRSGRNPLLDVFDCPDPSTKTPSRAVTTTPLQALALMNNSLILRMSDRLAERAKRDAGEDVTKQLSRVYALCLSREPTAEELAEASPFVQTHGMPAFCRVLLNSSEFVCVD